MRRPKDLLGFLWGCALVAVAAVFYATGAGEDVRAVMVIVGALRIVLSFFVLWRFGGGKPGPGTLTPTPTGRFRATGWPPSKNPDDYR